jgi:hypothetical protein
MKEGINLTKIHCKHKCKYYNVYPSTTIIKIITLIIDATHHLF